MQTSGRPTAASFVTIECNMRVTLSRLRARATRASDSLPLRSLLCLAAAIDRQGFCLNTWLAPAATACAHFPIQPSTSAPLGSRCIAAAYDCVNW